MLVSNKNKKVKTILLSFFILASIFAVFFIFQSNFALAQSGTEINIAKIRATISTIKIIQYILAGLGIVALGFIIYAIYIWKKYNYDPDKVDKAKKILIIAGIVLAVILILQIVGLVVNSSLQKKIAAYYAGLEEKVNRAFLYEDIFKINSIQTSCGQSAQTNQDVYLCSAVVINFNHYLDEFSVKQNVDKNNLRIEKCNDNNCQNVSVPEFYPADYKDLPSGQGSEWVVNQRSASFLHSELFKAKQKYRLVIPKSLSSLDGLKLDNEQACPIDCSENENEYYWIFETGMITDDTPPEINQTYPQNSAGKDYPQEDINLAPILWVNFSEAIAPWSITAQNIKIRKINNIDEQSPENSGTAEEYLPTTDYTLTINSAGNGFEISNLSLDALSWYEIVVAEIYDLCGNALDAAEIWRFKTNNLSPGIKRVYPTNGYDQSCPDTNVFIEFKTSMYDAENNSCRVMRGGKGGGHVLDGDFLPNFPRKIQVVDDLPAENANPNDFCKIYKFVPQRLNFEDKTLYSVGVNTNLILPSGFNLNYGDSPPADDPSQGEWSFYVKPFGQCINQDGDIVANQGLDVINSSENNGQNSGSDSDLKIVENNQCLINQENIIYPSPNPYPDADQVCLNSLVSARFNQRIIPNSLKLSVEKCTGSVINSCAEGNSRETVGGEVKVFDFDNDSSFFQFIPHENFEAGEFYIITVKNAQSVSGKKLATAYSWIFETYNNINQGICTIEHIKVLPEYSYLNQLGAKQIFKATALDKDCAELNTDNLDFTWDSSDEKVATISSSNSSQEIATAVADGTAYISVANDDKNDKARIIVQSGGEITYCNSSSKALICQTDDSYCTNPRYPVCDTQSCICVSEEDLGPHFNILAINPQGQQSCTNLIGEVVFDRLMNVSTLNNNLRLFSLDGPGTVWEVDLKNNILEKGQRGCSNDAGCTQVKIYPHDVLIKGKSYTLEIIGGGQGIRSLEGGSLKNSFQQNFNLATDAEICFLKKIEITPQAYTFTRNGQEKDFLVIGQTDNGQEINSVEDVYAWTWAWDKIDKNDIISITNSKNETEKITARNRNGQATLKATALITADIFGQTEGKLYVGLAQINNRLCQNPWPANGQPYQDTSGFSNFSIFYCRDQGTATLEDDLPGLKNPQPVEPGAGILREYLLLRDDESTDAIGIRIFDNPQHFSPEDWYIAQGFSSTAGLPSLKVDGYSAIQDGRSVYISAATLSTNSKLYTNIYLISYNQNASAETIEILNRLMSSLRFNINLTDYRTCSDNLTHCLYDSDCPLGGKCNADKTKLIRDTQRLNDLAALKKYLDNYYQLNGYYPQLESGSYQTGQSTSKWPSWGQTLAVQLEQTLPVDPINEFKLPCHPTENDNYDQQSCWNDLNKVFICPSDSYIYQYQSLNNGTNYRIYVNIEYEGTGTWKNENDPNTCWDYSIDNH